VRGRVRRRVGVGPGRGARRTAPRGESRGLGRGSVAGPTGGGVGGGGGGVHGARREPPPRAAVQGDGKSVDQILDDDDGTLHFAIGRWPTAAPDEAEVAAESEYVPETQWTELQGVDPEGSGYGQAVAVSWDSKGTPEVSARFFGSLSAGVPDGFGRLELGEAGTYMGAVVNGKPHGMGQLTKPNGDRYWGIWECGCYGQMGGGVGVWHWHGEEEAVCGRWYEGEDPEGFEAQTPGLLELLQEDHEEVETCYTATEAAVKSAEQAIQRAGEAIRSKHASASSDQALQKDVGRRAYEAMSLRQLFPPGSSALAEGGVVDRMEQRAATKPSQRQGGVNGGERDTHLLKHKIAKRFAVDMQTSKRHEAGHFGSDPKGTCSPSVPGATTREQVCRRCGVGLHLQRALPYPAWRGAAGRVPWARARLRRTLHLGRGKGRGGGGRIARSAA
jgi:hypothetical protein